MSLKNLSFRSRMLLLVGLFLLRLACTHAMYVTMLGPVQIHGTIYQRIAAKETVLAALEPPPILEAYVATLHLVAEPDAARRQALVQTIEQQEARMESLQRSWEKTLDDETLKDAVVRAYRPAR